jgi:hypothetical protein
MFHANPLAERASAIISERTAQNFKALSAEQGVKDPAKLPESLQLELLQSATLGAAATTCPTGNIEKLRHWLRSHSHPAFQAAMNRVALLRKVPGAAFDILSGAHAAVFLAGWGLPVAPFDLAKMCIKAEPSNDIDAVHKMFATDNEAIIGYSTCDAPFYLVLTDCLTTLRRLLPNHPMLAELRQLLARRGSSLPSNHGQLSTPGMMFLDRQVGDTISTVLLDPQPMGGTINLYAGWRVNDEPYGVPNDGCLPVPAQLLRSLMDDPGVGWWFWHEPGASTTMH